MDPRPNIALVPVERDIDVTTVDALRSVIDGLIDDGCRRIVLNMSGARYVDSAGMALILGEVRRMRHKHGLISLINVSDEVLRILKRARLVDFAPVSGVGSARAVSEPSPTEQPLWRAAVPVDAEDLSLTRASIARLLERVPLTPDERFDASLAVGEAVGNAVDHTDGQGAVVTVTGFADRAVIEVSDCGAGFDPDEASCEPVDPDAERGRGIKLMRLLADSVTIAPRPSGQGMLVRIIKLAHATTD